MGLDQVYTDNERGDRARRPTRAGFRFRGALLHDRRRNGRGAGGEWRTHIRFILPTAMKEAWRDVHRRSHARLAVEQQHTTQPPTGALRL